VIKVYLESDLSDLQADLSDLSDLSDLESDLSDVSDQCFAEIGLG
jgi:hypothetical protein